jgi:MoaA/NifB/PqqE/SkfB family radical SAM enzyme
MENRDLMSVLNRVVPFRVKTYIKTLPVVAHHRDRQKFLEQYNRIVNEVYDPQLMMRTDDIDVAEIEINRNCNINCVMCNTSLSKRPQFNMDVDLFEHAVKYAKSQGKGETSLHTIGEPLMNNKLPEYFKILRKHGVMIRFSTNGLLLHKKLDLLIDNADIMSELRFSIDGASKETYEKIRYGGEWDRLIANLEEFREKTQGRPIFKRVKIGSIVSEDVRHELGYHLKFWSRYTTMESIDLNLVSGLSPDNTYFLTKTILKNHIAPWPPCYMLFSPALHILNDGRATACCRDYNGDLVYGNIRDSSPKELINCDNVLELRRQHLENRIPKGSLCASCFCINPTVSQLFRLFVAALIKRFSNDWDAPKMQKRFEEFFGMFSTGIPNRVQFGSLLRS